MQPAGYQQPLVIIHQSHESVPLYKATSTTPKHCLSNDYSQWPAALTWTFMFYRELAPSAFSAFMFALLILSHLKNSENILLSFVPHQWVSLSVTLRHLLGWGALLGRAVSIISHVLRPQLEQRLPVLLQWGGVPWICVIHPLGWIFPCSSFAVQLQERQKRERGQSSFLF